MELNCRLGGRGLRSVADLGNAKPHGERLRYLAGCRCLRCKMANTNYVTGRAKACKAGDWNGVVDAAQARTHIMKLARAGVGYRTIASSTDIATSILCGIKSGTRMRARARTVRKILAVTTGCRGDHALVPAAGSWRKIRRLLEEGYTRGAIARMLGCQMSALQLGKRRITVRNRAKVDNVYRRLMS